MSNSLELNDKEKNLLDFPTTTTKDPFLKYKKYTENEEDFLSRNYKIKKSKEEFKMMTESELNNLFYKLKFYYDDISSQNNKQDSTINYIRTRNKNLEQKINDIERGKEVESGTEKISGLDRVNNIDFIINKIQTLKERTEEAKFNVKNEEEYTSTLKYLMEDSKNVLMKVNEDILVTEEKIHDIKRIRKNLDENIENRKNANEESNKINNYLENQIGKIKEVLAEQEDKKMSIEKSNQIKEEKLFELREKYEKNIKDNKIKFKQHKEETSDKINAFNYRKYEKQKKEKEIINFIVGFHFFQKYFINKNRENKDKELDESIDLSESKKDIEFNNFMKGVEYELVFSDEEENNEELNNDNKKKIKIKNKKKIQKLNFEEIKERFDELDLKYDEFNDFLTKIISKANFSRKKMTDLNMKLISLESKKNEYTQKVDNIIFKDYKNLIDIIYNTMHYDEFKKKQIIRFKKFIEENKNNLKNAQKIRNIKTTQRITDIHFEEITNPDTNKIKKQNTFMDKCLNEIAKIKFYFESFVIGMKHLNNFKEYDNAYKKENNSLNEIMPLTTGFTKQCKKITNENYIQDLLKYAIEKNIPKSNFIYEILFVKNKHIDNMKQFLKDKLTIDNFVFYFFRGYKERFKLNKLINERIYFYIGGNKQLLNSKKYSIIEPNNISSQKKRISNLNIQSDNLVFNKQNTIVRKNRFSVLLKGNNSDEKKKLSLEEEINKKYNYENSPDDYSINEIKKKVRPRTTKLTTYKRVTQHLYEPSLKKGLYLRTLNNDLNNIKNNRLNRKFNSRYFKKTWNNIDNLDNQFYVYNNKSKIYIFYFIFRY